MALFGLFRSRYNFVLFRADFKVVLDRQSVQNLREGGGGGYRRITFPPHHT